MQLHHLINKKNIVFSITILLFLVVLSSRSVFAVTEDELRNQINEKSSEIQKLQKEIDEYSKLYTATTKQSQTLKTTLAALEISKKKLQTELSLTDKKIKSTSSNIDKLEGDLSETQKSIDTNSKALASSLASLYRDEAESPIENFLKYRSLSEAWDSVMSLNKFQRQVNVGILTAKDLRQELQSQKTELELENKNLLSYQSELSGKKVAVEYSQKEKDSLLSKTKNKESEYEALLKQKQLQREAFEKELFAAESALRIIIDPSSIPDEKSGVLSWPVSNVQITQYFGKTVSAKKLYVSGTHNGIDFRASIGTTVKAALSGTVWATGNTDIARGCYSYGKWVLVRHANGLSTIYAHLSQISVTPGSSVITGDTLGYSGNTGYSTGPHLHFGVYATQGVVVEKYVNSIACKSIVLPLADPKAYLDPMSYLPK